MVARRYEFYVQVAGTISHEWAMRTSKILFLPREHKIQIYEPTCNVLFSIWRNQFNKNKRRESWRHWTTRHSQRWHTKNTPLGSRMKWRIESTSGLVPSKTVKHSPPYNKCMYTYLFLLLFYCITLKSGSSPRDWLGTLCCVFGKDNLLSQCISPSRSSCINGYPQMRGG